MVQRGSLTAAPVIVITRARKGAPISSFAFLWSSVVESEKLNPVVG